MLVYKRKLFQYGMGIDTLLTLINVIIVRL